MCNCFACESSLPFFPFFFICNTQWLHVFSFFFCVCTHFASFSMLFSPPVFCFRLLHVHFYA
ncbi:hypothetical protein DPX39_010035400 [Trypanosoma brucei equiperdum]|uniref:Uncharacterized protein n=1 Tax=Trypanosoma brucei equiperdum TaxID=630700 RepID=A0A3L6LCD8_9TRYP|nr:hypothetical protein DPX39_010035400 [Trypanosoma brucei equiperdum]